MNNKLDHRSLTPPKNPHRIVISVSCIINQNIMLINIIGIPIDKIILTYT